MRYAFIPTGQANQDVSAIDNRIIAYVSIGDAARTVSDIALASLLGNYTGNTYCISQVEKGDKTGRATKTFLPFFLLNNDEYVLYLDADTTLHGSLEPLFQILEDGWDMVIAPSTYQGEQAMHHIGDIERNETLDIYGFNPLQLQGGVIAFRNNGLMKEFFHAWHSQWQRYEEQDQAALLRALHEWNIRVWIVGNAFNGGEVIQHHFGSIK